jgi:pimeloyl-ACP methyl ester carboxylesterase
MAAASAAAGAGPTREGTARQGGLKPPHLLLALSEGRAWMELAGTLAARRTLMTAPRGDGHPVIALPGFLASDRSTVPLRTYLSRLGYDARPWGHGQNLGRFYRMRDVLAQDVERVHRETGRRVSLVGWSLGGVFARAMALQVPDSVRSVVTLGSPFAANIHATNARRLYEAMSKEGPPRAGDLEALAGDLPRPNTSIYSRLDGIVNWRTCIPRPAANAEAIEIRLASHVGIGVNPAALWAVADRLVQAEDQFAPFRRTGPFALAYGP